MSPQPRKLTNETINFARRIFCYSAKQVAEIFDRHLVILTLGSMSTFVNRSLELRSPERGKFVTLGPFFARGSVGDNDI